MALKAGRIRFHNIDDEQLLGKYQESGDLDILGELYSRYMHLVYGICLKYLGDRESASDAVISIFEKLITELSKHSVEKFKPWLYVLSRNYCLMAIRTAKSEREHMKKAAIEQELFMENDIELHPIDSIEGIDDIALEECIKRLKEEQRECIRLFYYESRSYREIADILKQDEKRVKSYIQNAKRNLKLCLEESYVREE
jgi:RNA polymerase sigma-70 factor (ECF subfamily)